MRRIALYGVIIFQLALIVSLIKGISTSQKASMRIALMKEQRDKLVDEKNKLQEQQQYVQSPYYLEKVAREELRLSKPGETVVILPNDKTLLPENNAIKDDKKEVPNWLKWWEVLSGK